MDVDSPGGSVFGLKELSQKIFDARGTKPIYAVANSMAGSAAYYIASAADQMIVTPSGEVGSIGTIAIHEDMSVALENEGVKITVIKAGRFKGEGNNFEPLSEEAISNAKREVDAYYGQFVDAVARNRGVSPKAVRNGFGEGRMVMR